MPHRGALDVTDRLDAAGSGRKPFAHPSAQPHEPRERGFDLQHLRLEIAFDIGRRHLFGRTVQTFTPLRPGLQRLTLDCVELEVRSVSGDGGKALPFAVAAGHLAIDLPRAAAPGEKLTVEIVYEGSPRAGLFFVKPDAAYPTKPLQIWTQGEMEDTRYWVPTWDAPNDKATTEVIVTVPEGWTAVSNGALVDRKVDPRKHATTFHWKQDLPHSPYLLSLVAGEFDEVHARSASGVPLQYYVPKGRAEEIERSFAKTPAMVDFFESWFGVPYPWAKYAQAVIYDFTFGGMENTSATTLTDRTLHDARAHGDYHSEPLVAHELAHQWWGDLVTCRGWEHLWLNEGFATYSETLWKEHDEGADEAAFDLLDKADRYFKEDEDSYRRPIVQRVWTEPGELFDRHAYEKASLVLHMLRYVLGDDAFRRGLREYVARTRERTAETAELRLALEDVTGLSLGWFFDEWLDKPGFPELKVEARHDDTARRIVVRVRQTQDGSDGTPVFRMPLVVRVWHAGGFADHRVEIAERDQVFHLPAAETPQALTMDPGNHVLKKLAFERPVEWLEVELCRSEAAVDRGLAARALAAHPSARAVPLLAQALRGDPSWRVRAQAAKALGRSRGAGALEALLEGLGSEDSRVRAAVAEGLGELKDGRALDALTRLLGADASYYARAEAARALGRIGFAAPDVREAAFAAMREALGQDSHREIIRSKALEGLAELHEKRAVALASEWSAYGRPPLAREAAIKALGKLGKDDDAVREQLEALLASDPYIWARKAAIDALGERKEGSALPALERAAAVEIDSRLRRAARDAMARIREKTGADTAGELERLREDNRALTRRFSALEARVEERK